MCDAGTLWRAGIPVVVFGPGKIHQSHRVDEWVYRKDVEDYAEIIAQLIRRGCG